MIFENAENILFFCADNDKKRYLCMRMQYMWSDQYGALSISMSYNVDEWRSGHSESIIMY